MSFDFSPGSLIAGFVFSVVGIYLFRQGRSRAKFAYIFIGLALMIYPLFISNAWMSWGIGCALTAYAYVIRWD